MSSDLVRVFVGTDRSQLLAVKILEHSIRRHSSIPVEVTPMLDLKIPKPVDPRQGQRTGFSFSRFCIPGLCDYKGKAIYMDADMLVFKDIAELWNMPFNGHKVLIQQELTEDQQNIGKKTLGAPGKRVKQCAVMLLDCGALTWKIEDIVRGLDEERYNYEKLMFEFCLLKDDEIGFDLPFQWNSLEHFDETTRLIHYTDMYTQPWVSARNPNAYLWFNEIKLMLENGSITEKEIQQEIDLTFFRPSLLLDVKYQSEVPPELRSAFADICEIIDKREGYKPHKSVYEAKQLREKLIKEYEKKVGAQAAPKKADASSTSSVTH